MKKICTKSQHGDFEPVVFTQAYLNGRSDDLRVSLSGLSELSWRWDGKYLADYDFNVPIQEV